jgi:GH25 family lysozyme M1 (1,4-beta-N-acetylmuramidase)
MLPGMTDLLVPDLSEWQGGVNWGVLIGAGYPAAIIRVYNGYRPDTEFLRNRDQAHRCGIRALGLYAYLAADGDVADQAAQFVHLVSPLRAGEWPIVDCEDGTNSAERVREWSAYVGRALGYGQPWLYSGEWFYQQQHLDQADVPASRTWLAAYGPSEPREGHELWQYTDHRTVPGVDGGAVDCSVFHGDIAQLVAAVAGAPASPTPGPTVHPRFPFPAGLHPGGTSPSARPLQDALKKTGWMDQTIADSDHYGPATQQGVAGFNLKHGFNDAGKSWDPAIGPRGWALLMTLAYGAA